MAKHYAWLNTGTGEFGREKNWPDCESKTKGVKGRRFKSFGTEKLAQEWLDSGGEYEKKTDKIKEEIKIELKELPATTIFFDAGTGGPTKGVKVRVTDKFKNPLLQKVCPFVPEVVTSKLGADAPIVGGIKVALDYAEEQIIMLWKSQENDMEAYMDILLKERLVSYYEKHILEDVMPFWDRRCIDKEYGGYIT